jgi:hypothetical protein
MSVILPYFTQNNQTYIRLFDNQTISELLVQTMAYIESTLNKIEKEL